LAVPLALLAGFAHGKVGSKHRWVIMIEGDNRSRQNSDSAQESAPLAEGVLPSPSDGAGQSEPSSSTSPALPAPEASSSTGLGPPGAQRGGSADPGPAGCRSEGDDKESVDQAELGLLCRSLDEYDAPRKAAGAEHQADDIQLVCLTLMVGPAELGAEARPSPTRNSLNARLAAVRGDSLPELRLCRLWLTGSLGEWPKDSAAEITSLARLPLWEPIQSLAFRALAHLGRQDLLEDLLRQAAPRSMVWEDARLEIGLGSTEGDLAPGLFPDLATPWQALLSAERKLAGASKTDAVEDALREVMKLPESCHSLKYTFLERQRIAARAAAALVRLRLSRHQDDDGTLSSPVGLQLPAWERAFLGALTRWVGRDMSHAETLLEEAARLNPAKSCIRLALASAMASRDPSAALSHLHASWPTREVLVSRAALLVRMGRYDEAEAAIQAARVNACPSEPIRYSWPAARRRFRWQELAIRTGLAEHRGNWKQAQAAWREACALCPKKSRNMARSLFQMCRERQLLQAEHGWRRDELDRGIQRIVYEMGAIPLRDSDAFFRGMASLNSDPGLAEKDLLSLLRRQAWMAGEAGVGGTRLLALGDTIASMGRFDEALRTYQCAHTHGENAGERVAVMQLLVKVEQSGSAAEIVAASKAVESVSSNQAWLKLITGMGLMIAGQQPEARHHIQAAADLGARPALCRCLAALADVCSGQTTKVSSRELAAAGLKGEAASLVQLLLGEAKTADAVFALIERFGDRWVENCPVDAQRLVRSALAELCDAHKWDKAASLDSQLRRIDADWAKTLTRLVTLRRLLRRLLQHADKAPDVYAELESIQKPVQDTPMDRTQDRR
jgi:tetratricopeptide (TPR) repeat protein